MSKLYHLLQKWLILLRISRWYLLNTKWHHSLIMPLAHGLNGLLPIKSYRLESQGNITWIFRVISLNSYVISLRPLRWYHLTSKLIVKTAPLAHGFTVYCQLSHIVSNLKVISLNIKVISLNFKVISLIPKWFHLIPRWYHLIPRWYNLSVNSTEISLYSNVISVNPPPVISLKVLRWYY